MESDHISNTPLASLHKRTYISILAVPASIAAVLGVIVFFVGMGAGGAKVQARSFLSGSTPHVLAAGPEFHYNSQNVPLLKPAFNLDPNPAKGGGEIAFAGGTALVPLDGPSGTLADILERPASSQISVYTVRSGDSLSSLAKMFSVSVNTIIWANDLGKSTIREGQTLIILPVNGVRHTVAKGETLASIAKKFDGDAEEIAQFNDLTVGEALTAGRVVLIPNGEVVAPAAPKPKASTGVARTTAPVRGASTLNADGYYFWPLDGGVLTQHLHGYNGVDIGARTGTNIYASAAGTVIIAKSSGWNAGYGNYIVIQHGNGTQTLYAHASKIFVSVGDTVAQGTAIGAVGSTGKSTGPHLHFEVRGARNPFN